MDLRRLNRTRSHHRVRARRVFRGMLRQRRGTSHHRHMADSELGGHQPYHRLRRDGRRRRPSDLRCLRSTRQSRRRRSPALRTARCIRSACLRGTSSETVRARPRSPLRHARLQTLRRASPPRQVTRSVFVTWAQPPDGGSPITTYKVFSGGGTLRATVSAPDTSVNITGLTNGTSYSFKVRAINAAGAGPDSTASTAVTPAGSPSAPLSLAASAGNGLGLVSWTKPASAGGSAILSYTVTAAPGGQTITVSAATTNAAVAAWRTAPTTPSRSTPRTASGTAPPRRRRRSPPLRTHTRSRSAQRETGTQRRPGRVPDGRAGACHRPTVQACR